MNKFYLNILKTIFDFLISLLGFIIISPLLLILIIIIIIESPGGAFFSQKRIGSKKKHFTLYKFRTMKKETPTDTPTHLLNDPDEYITKTGRFMRKFSLDELPQLINIIKGDMALVGPRPALWNQYDLIKERDKYGVNDIKPGITGLAQVKGRDELPIDIKANLDGEYKKNISFCYDMKILYLTIPMVFKAKGIKEGR